MTIKICMISATINTTYARMGLNKTVTLARMRLERVAVVRVLVTLTGTTRSAGGLQAE